jgi:hypothetical protein
MVRTKTKVFLKRKKVPKFYFHFGQQKKCPPFSFNIYNWRCENITASSCVWIWLMLIMIILFFGICWNFSDVLLEWYLSCKTYYDCFRSKTVCCQLKTGAFMFQYAHPEALFPSVHRQRDHTCTLGINVWR